MPTILKNNYYIKYDERTIHAFVCTPDPSWIEGYRADMRKCFEELIIREAEYISLGIASIDNLASENCLRVDTEAESIMKDAGIYNKYRARSCLSNSASLAYIDGFLNGLDESKKQEAYELCGVKQGNSSSYYSHFFSFMVRNEYYSETNGQFIMQKALLEERLKELAETPYSEIPFGAMCYSIVFPEIRYVEYPCPVCGNTSKCKEDDINALEKVRKIVSELKNVGYDLLLREPEYCENCRQIKSDSEQGYDFQIRLTHDGDYHLVTTNDSYDFVCLHSFLMGGIGYHANRTDEMLHDKIDTINKMTGLGVQTVLEWLKNHKAKKRDIWNGY